MTNPASKPADLVIGPSDRLGFTLFLALALHVIFILGVGFTPSEARQSEAMPSLDIILANTESAEQPDDPDFLSQSNQVGGGNQDDKARPSAPVSAPTPIDQQGLNDRSQMRKTANRIRLENIYYVNLREAQRKIDKAHQKDRAERENDSEFEIEQLQMDIASLRAELRKMTEAYAKRPREITLTANTREAVEAGYLAQWVSKIEHIGNLNYPAEAEVNRIDGSLRVNVRINSSGQVLSIEVSRPSGHSILDQAARRIVRLAEPFPPFPAKLREKADQIVIVRTWEFKSNTFTTSSGQQG